MEYLQRHMVFYNHDLKYNRISFNLNVQVEKISKEQLLSLLKDAKKDNLKIIEKMPNTEIMFMNELKLDKTYNKEIQFLDSEHCKLINENYSKVKKEYNEILRILNLYLITPVKVEYFENYYII